MSRLAAIVWCLVLGVAVTACSGDPAEDGNGADPGDGLATYETERLSFQYPDEFAITEEGQGDEQRVLISSPDGGEPADATILALWPLATSDSLERTVGFFGPDTTSSAVSDFEEQAIEVPGASDAVEHRFVATDAVPGETRPMDFVSVYAMADTGRTFYLVVGVDPESAYDLDALAETVLGSLQLSGAEAGGDEASSANAAPALLDGRVHLAVPEGWEVDEVGERMTARPADDDRTLLTLVHLPDEGFEDLDGALEDLLADTTGVVTREANDVPGALEAQLVRRETEAGLWQQIVIARDDDGRTFAVVLAADTAAMPSPQVVEGIFGSFALAGDDGPDEDEPTDA